MRTFDDQPLGETGGPTALIQVEPGAEVATLPDPAFLAGEFARNGSDLMLESPDGDSLVLRDYFANETPPDLAVGEARLSGPTVETLAGPLAPAQVAQTGPDAGRDGIGEVTELTGAATVVRTGGAIESLSLGDPIFLGDTLRTGAGSSVGVTFIDDTLFSLSEDARLVIDRLIFNPGGGGNELSLSLLQGAASFLAGQIAPSDGEGMKVTTPVGTIGVRGTQVVMFYDAVEQILEAVLVEDLDGGIGAATIFNNVSSQTISALREGVVVTGLDQPAAQWRRRQRRRRHLRAAGRLGGQSVPGRSGQRDLRTRGAAAGDLYLFLLRPRGSEPHRLVHGVCRVPAGGRQ